MRIQKHLATEYSYILAITKEELSQVYLQAVDHLLFAKDSTGRNIVDARYLKKQNPFNVENISFWLPKAQYEEVRRIAKTHDVDIDEVVSFALFMYLPFKKKAVLDKLWNRERLLIALDKFNILDEVRVIKQNEKQEEFIVLNECPLCGHESPSIYANETLSANCFSGKCGLKDGWHIFFNQHSFKQAIEAVWDAGVNNYEKNSEKVKRWLSKRKPQPSNTKAKHFKGKLQQGGYNITPRLIYIIQSQCDQQAGFEYMFKKGFKRQDLLDCDFFYHDGLISQSFREVNNFRYRAIYLIRDLDGNPVGINGRSIIDNDYKRKEFVENDKHWRGELKQNKGLNKLFKKSLNNVNFHCGDHLYLLHKYKDWQQSNSFALTRTVYIVEGPKDAIRVYAFIKNDSSRAVVSPVGAKLTSKQVERLKQVFAANVCIVMAFDQDKSGIEGNLRGAEKLKQAGFEEVYFLRYKKNFKDFGDVNAKQYTERLVLSMLGDLCRRQEYIKTMRERGIEFNENVAG